MPQANVEVVRAMYGTVLVRVLAPRGSPAPSPDFAGASHGERTLLLLAHWRSEQTWF
jgi:hypothetical protein